MSKERKRHLDIGREGISRTTLWRLKKARLLENQGVDIHGNMKEFDRILQNLSTRKELKLANESCTNEDISVSALFESKQNLIDDQVNALIESHALPSILPTYEDEAESFADEIGKGDETDTTIKLCGDKSEIFCEDESEILAEIPNRNDMTFIDPIDDILLEMCREIQQYRELNNDVLRPASFDDLLQNEKFYETIRQSCNKSPAEVLLMVLKFSVKNKLSLSAISQLMTLINNMFAEPILPDSKYMIEKLLNPKEDVEYHAVCHNCNAYVGKFIESKSSVTCANCHEDIDLKHLSSLDYFILINPSESINQILSKNVDYYEYVMHNRVQEKSHFRDIYDGRCYKQFKKKLADCDKSSYITVTFNTDGAPIFECSQYSIWPVYLIINEIPPQERFNNPIVCALWFGKQKPDIRVLMHQFVQMMNKLSSSGIKCSIRETLQTIKVYCIVACVDTVARAPMLGKNQFNGKCGCDWCLHPGVHIDGSMRFILLDIEIQDRDHKTMIKHMKAARRLGEPVYGVKHPSPLINLDKFDVINGCVPEYMHFYVGGVAKRITGRMLKCLSDDEIALLNLYLFKIKAPNLLCRLTKPLNEKKDWKSREWENWVLYYSIPILSIVIDESYMRHWVLIVDSLHILLQTDITSTQLTKVNDMLFDFVKDVERLYGPREMTYNVHQMLHVVQSVVNWGPLWAHSAYAFENANNVLLRAIKCAKGVTQQITRYLQIQRSLALLQSNVYTDCSSSTRKFCEYVIDEKVMRTFKLGQIRYFGCEMFLEDEILNKFQLPQHSTRAYVRMVKNRCLYMSYKKCNPRSCDSYAQLNDGKFVKLYAFLIDEKNKKEWTLCHTLQTKANKFSKIIKEVTFISNDLTIIPTDEIANICVYMEVQKLNYICSVPNSLYY